MKSLYFRCIAIIIPILIFWFILTSWLHSYIEFDPMHPPNVDFKIVREKIKQHTSQNTEIDYEGIRDIAKDFEMSVSVLDKSEHFINIPELTEIKRKGYLEFFDENNRYSQLIQLREPDLILELSEKGSLLQDSELLDFISMILLVALSATGLYIAINPFEVQLANVLNNLSLLNSDGKASRLNNTQSGTPGDIARELDILTDNLSKLVENRTSLLVAHQDLLHGVAHEFRSPMARLNFAVEMLNTAKTDMDADSLYEDICTALEEMDQLVKEVLQYSRLQHGDKVREYNRFNIIELVRSVITKQKSITPRIAIKYEGEDIEIQAIEYLIERAIINLLRNACHFAQRNVLISWQRQDNDILIKVANDGIGIPPGKRELIFEPFTRLDPSRSRESGGIGLGLSITKSICTNHHGTITVGESPLGGAEFRIRIPTTYKVPENI
ncbi:MAG: ATP-binding protein [Candidatus Thiodiazotropha sp.]